MSLDFRLEKIKNWEEVCLVEVPEDERNNSAIFWWDDKRALRGETQSSIFAMLGCGIGELTTASAQEFFVRTRLLNALFGYYGSFTPDHIRKYIGLRINVKTEGRATWTKRMVESKMLEWDKEYFNNAR